MNDPISRLVPLADAGITSRSFDAPPQPVQVTAVKETQGNNTRETGADQQGRLQEQIAEVVERLNERMQSMKRALRFSVDDTSGRIVVKVVDRDTDEVIRQIPSEEMLAIMNQINDGDGRIFDARA
ncbi:MAG: flagellar protein FlaG [Pseudomonadota bacterium]